VSGPGAEAGTVVVLAVGEELLLGDGVNTNLAWLGAQAAAVGLRVVGAEEVGDGVTEIVAALRRCAARADAVVVTGGLGPTSDDRTREALAAFAGVGLVRDADELSRILGWFAARGRTAPPAVATQADALVGARLLTNPLGTAPGLAVEVAGTLVVALPGVPAELAALWHADVADLLVRRAGHPAPLLTRQVRVVGRGESDVAHRLAGVEAALPPQVQLAYLASPSEVRVRLTGRDPAVLAALLDEVAAVLGDAVAARDGQSLPEAVVAALAGRGLTVACAESLTGGALAAALVDVAGASGVLRGGVVAYSLDAKARLLGVDPALLAATGGVDPEVAVAMARGAAAALGADIGVATTGVAGPDPVGEHPVGEVHVAVAGPGTHLSSQALRLVGDRALVRAVTTTRALDLLRRALLAPPA